MNLNRIAQKWNNLSGTKLTTKRDKLLFQKVILTTKILIRSESGFEGNINTLIAFISLNQANFCKISQNFAHFRFAQFCKIDPVALLF